MVNGNINYDKASIIKNITIYLYVLFFFLIVKFLHIFSKFIFIVLMNIIRFLKYFLNYNYMK
jgi:hypothetical protein